MGPNCDLRSPQLISTNVSCKFVEHDSNRKSKDCFPSKPTDLLAKNRHQNPPLIRPKEIFNWLCCAIAAICLASQVCLAQVVLPFGSSWEFLHPINGINPAIADADFATTWHTPTNYDGPAFNEPSRAMLGYGSISGKAIATDIATPAVGDRFSAYFRTTVNLAQDHDWLLVEILADDGGIFYIDGKATAFLN